MEKTMKPLCIYHGHCDDGFAAAWCVRDAVGDDVEFYAGVYQQDPPDVTGRGVIFVDFSYKRPVIDKMRETAAWIKIIDHHKTAIEDLSGMEEQPHLCPIELIFDMNRSGAGLAWDVYHPGTGRPGFINYVEDRDLWRKALPGGDEFTIALRSYPQDFKVWDELVMRGPQNLIAEGLSIQRYYRQRVEELKRSAYEAVIDGYAVRIANAPYFAASEVAGEISDATGFGACYFEARPGQWQYSLRSRGDFDVSAVAKKFGGGGHKAAAGFTVNEPVHQRV